MHRPSHQQLTSIHRRTVALLSGSSVLGGISSSSIIGVATLLVTDITGSEAMSGISAASLTLGAGVFAPPLARLAQLRGRRVALSTGSAIAFFGAVLIIVAAMLRSLPLLIAANAMFGASGSVALQARFAATDLSKPKHRARDLSLVVGCISIGSVIGPTLMESGEALGAALGLPLYSGTFLFPAAVQFICFWVFFIGLRPDPLQLRARMADEGFALTSAVTIPEHGTPTAQLRVLRSNGSRIVFGVISLGVSHAIMVPLMSLVPLHMGHHGHGLGATGLLLSIHVLAMYGFAPVFGILSDRLGSVRMIFIGQGVLLTATIILSVLNTDMVWVYIGMILLGIGWSIGTVSGAALVNESAASESRTRVQGWADFMMSLLGGLAGLGSGLLLAWIGYSGLGWVSAAAAVLVPVSGLLLWRSMYPERARRRRMRRQQGSESDALGTDR